MSPTLWGALLFAAVAPLPGPNDVRAGETASGCIYYYRLQTTGVPGGSRACEAAGYGLDFMRAHWKDIEAVEEKRKERFDEALKRGREIDAARAHAAELRGPCEAMILDGGPGPDGGQALCDMAGFTRVLVVREADRARREQERQHRHMYRVLAAVVLALGGLALLGIWRGWSR